MNKTKENGTKYFFWITNTHVTLLHSLRLPTDSLDTSKRWWRINSIIHRSLGVRLTDQLTVWRLPGSCCPLVGRNETIHWATLTQLLLVLKPSFKISCTRSSPLWRHHRSADKRTSPPWTPGCPLVQKRGWCCWKERGRTCFRSQLFPAARWFYCCTSCCKYKYCFPKASLWKVNRKQKNKSKKCFLCRI